MRLIDADAYLYKGDLENEPTINAEPVRHGKWFDVGSLSCRCDQCGCKNNKETPYCPNCGAKMESE